MLHVLTERLELRSPVETDRERFIELFSDESFMAYSGGVLDSAQASARFDHMLLVGLELAFAKQPVIEPSSGRILGYSGVDWFDFQGEPCVEFGYRLCTDARGQGYATEAGLALIELARQHFSGTIYAMIDPRNAPSMRVIDKLGFTFWKLEEVNGYVDRLYRLELP